MINWVIDKTLKQNYTVLHNEILYNKSKTKSCEIMIPNTVGNIKVKTIGIWLSGGVDSAILLSLIHI